MHSSLPRMDWAFARSQDPEYEAIYTYLCNEDETHLPVWFKQLRKEERAMFSRIGNYVVVRGRMPKARSRWMMPKDLQRSIIAAFHAGGVGAHLGVSKTVGAISTQYY